MRHSDHYELGYGHYLGGLPRYKFQDAHLQDEYNQGWNAAAGTDISIVHAQYTQHDKLRDFLKGS